MPVDYKVSFDYYTAAHHAGFAKGHFALGTAYVIFYDIQPLLFGFLHALEHHNTILSFLSFTSFTFASQPSLAPFLVRFILTFLSPTMNARHTHITTIATIAITRSPARPPPLPRRYMYGRGVEKNFAQAAALYEAAAEQKVKNSLTNLGALHEQVRARLADSVSSAADYSE